MIKNINAKDLITSPQFVSEPANQLKKSLEENKSKKIILTGGRGTGKSVVLRNYENKTINTPNPCIYTIFDGCGMGNRFDEPFYKHYYELIFSNQLLSFLKQYYNNTYQTYFRNYQQELEEIGNVTDRFMSNSAYEETTLSRYLEPHEYSQIIINELIKYLDINSLTLAIDRFDWTNQGTEYTQKILSNYFDLFDKTIITTDDDGLLEYSNRIPIEQKDYSFIDINYGKDTETIKEIIEKRIELYNENIPSGYRHFDINILTNDMYINLINSTNGNISLILSIIAKLLGLYQWNQGDNEFVNDTELDLITKDQVEQNNKVRKMFKDKKLYL